MLRLFLLGTAYAEYQGQILHFKRRKGFALLAYLALTSYRQSREKLATLFWPDADSSQARAALRRILVSIGETAAGAWLEADRDTIALKPEMLWVDALEFRNLLQGGIADFEQASSLYRDHFMAGFSLADSSEFDEWQSFQLQQFQQQYGHILERLSDHHLNSSSLQRGLELAQRWIALDPLNEAANISLFRFYLLTGQRNTAQQAYERYQALLEAELGTSPDSEFAALYQASKQDNTLTPVKQAQAVYVLPAEARLLIGRSQTLELLRQRLMPNENKPELLLQGWPGIGKTSLSIALAHDEALQKAYPDGVLWTSLGQNPNILAELMNWGRALGFSETATNQTIEQLTSRLRALLRERKMLLIVDDVWESSHALPFQIGSNQSAILMTSRFNDVSQFLASRPENIYKVPILSEEDSLELLRQLAPDLLKNYPNESRELVQNLEGLPLALQVAGRLLYAEMALGWGIQNLLAELHEGARLLEAQAPSDRYEIAHQTSPTIATLLQRSIERLPEEMQERFALLGVFAPKPASFTLDALQAVWGIPDVRMSVKMLVDRGLLEPLGVAVFQMHALLVLQARSMFEG